MLNQIIIFTAKYFFFVIIFLYLLYLWKANKKIRIALIKLSVISFPLTLLVGKIFSFFIYDPRPFVVEQVKPLIAHAADNGFPSDHTLLTMAIASVVFLYNRKLGILLYIIGLIIGTARVLAYIHHSLDIIGATVIAIVTTAIVFVIEKRWHQWYIRTNKNIL